MIKLAGGRWSAEAAAAVTQPPFRVYDCQLRVGGTVAVRRAQRQRRDVTVETKKTDVSRDRRVTESVKEREGKKRS